MEINCRPVALVTLDMLLNEYISEALHEAAPSEAERIASLENRGTVRWPRGFANRVGECEDAAARSCHLKQMRDF